MWEGIKIIAGLVLLIGLILAVASTFFIFSWVFKIIGFLLACLFVAVVIGYVAWELLSGWWQDRK